MSVMKCTAAGDAMIFRQLPGHYEGFEALRDFIAQGELRFLNLETTIHNFETYGAALSGGSWFCAEPRVLDGVKEFGFNMLTTANNHAMDYSHAGLLKTLEYLQAAGLPACGTGRSLAEAAAPIYLDAPGGRYAVIGTCSTFYPDAMAGEQTRTMPGRPGLNGLRFDTRYELPEAQLAQLREIAAALDLNADRELERSQGYLPELPDGAAEFGAMRIARADKPGIRTRVNETDMARTEKMIREARFMADYVIVSIHSHECAGAVKSEPAEFCVEFAHRCIDAGAHAIVGTGPHMLRPIEIYKGCPIFYSLGDFIIQLETVKKAPVGFFEKQGMTGSEGLDEMFEKRSDHGRKGLYYSRVMFEAIVPYWEAEDGKLRKLKLLPVELGFGKKRSVGGWPAPDAHSGILERLAEMSLPYGTKIEIGSDGIGTVLL